jgi:pumilio family protein 6
MHGPSNQRVAAVFQHRHSEFQVRIRTLRLTGTIQILGAFSLLAKEQKDQKDRFTMTAMTSSSSKRKGDGSFNKKIKKAKVEPVEKQQSSSQQKRAVKHERQSHRKHADAVATSKEIWNKLRLKNNSPEETRRLMEELMGLLRGKVNEVALQHDASRVVQAAIQFGTREERKEIVMELCQTGSLAELSKVQYAHFAVLKMIKYCSRDEECVRAIVKVRARIE